MSLVSRIRQSQEANRAQSGSERDHLRAMARALIAHLDAQEWHCDPQVTSAFRSLAARVATGEVLTDSHRREAIALLNRILGALTDAGHPDRVLMGESLVDEVRKVFRK